MYIPSCYLFIDIDEIEERLGKAKSLITLDLCKVHSPLQMTAVRSLHVRHPLDCVGPHATFQRLIDRVDGYIDVHCCLPW